MSMTNPQAHNKNKDIQVRRSRLLACGLSLMIGLSGCSDSGELTQAGTGDTQDTSTGTTENQDNTNQETGDSSEIEENAPSDEIGGGGDQGDSESPGNGDSGNSGSGDGDSSEDNTPTDTSKLHVKFTRPAPVANSAPHIQRQHQELSGRLFQLEVYTIDDELNLQDITTEVTWNTISEECNGDPCYTLNSDGKLVAGAKGKFSVQAEYNGLLSSVVHLETPRKLETCGVEGNTNKTHRDQECLHIIVGSSGEANGKWFTEPARPQVMSYMYYTADRTPYNSGYTHSGFGADGGSGSNTFAFMRNDGFDESIEDTSTISGGNYGQYDRYCADLAAINFNGRDNWRRALEGELSALASDHSIGSTYDWPVKYFYAAANVHITAGGVKLRNVLMDTGRVESRLPSEKSYSTCVSEPPSP
ncbi:hypothetical protein OPW07_06660 [Vibrio europaeus]|uniref:hypothetical protein n=1 Tax=Vibrio europaeus TaxID=300876 RepID=UPI0018A76A4F|nr:hypothetical protein [Vibrio europaeus]MDC5809396.1 hypothetical protein [Vibrio europaeus]QPG35128.1 hypothetical protein IXK98_16775 [Vibrio europaeus]